MVEGKEFRELMLQVVRTRMAFRRSMQRTLKKNNAGITASNLELPMARTRYHPTGLGRENGKG